MLRSLRVLGEEVARWSGKGLGGSIARLVYWSVFFFSVFCSDRLRATSGLFFFRNRDATMHKAVEIKRARDLIVAVDELTLHVFSSSSYVQCHTGTP